MGCIVCKFGGSSTANGAMLRRVLDILRASPARRCVVLSAPGTDADHGEKVTALLERCWDADGKGPILQKIVERYGAIADALSVPGFRDTVKREIEAALGVSRDCLLSRGEYLCALLFSRFSRFPMIDAAKLVAFDASGELDEAGTQQNFASLAGAVNCPVIVPGFYGVDEGGRVHTFPRNGSDITGALAAAGMGAGLYENWTDVPGLMTADPELVPDARLIRQVGYRQMRMLARAGARVLHPACLDPVAMAGIPTRLRCTEQPDSFGTLIDEKVEGIAPCVAGRVEGDAASVAVFGAAGEPLRFRVSREQYPDSVRLLHRAIVRS